MGIDRSDRTLSALIEQSERDGGMLLKDIPDGALVVVRTKNSAYEIAVIDAAEGKVVIKGNNAYFAEAKLVRVNGSTWGGSALKMDWIGRNMHLEIYDGANTVHTSAIRAIVVENAPERVKELITTATK